MRINVYAEELGGRVELVTKRVSDEKFGERTFYGLRVYLKSPPELHSDPADDDTSAVTFWVPWTRAGGHDTKLLRHMVDRWDAMLKSVDLKDPAR